MKRRSKAGGKTSKARGRKALKPKRRDASKTASSSAPIQDAEVAWLTRELNEAREQQAATSQILGVINSSFGELERVFQSILKNTVRICDANFGSIYRWDGQALHFVSTHNAPNDYTEARRRLYQSSQVVKIQPGDPMDRVLATKAVVHVEDFAAEPSYTERRNPPMVVAVELGGARTGLVIPMLKDNELIGVFTLMRQEVRPFTDRQIALVQNFAAQAVIAIENARLLDELRQRTDDLTAHRRPHRGARAADCHVRGAPGYLKLSRRPPASICNHAGEGGPHVRCCFRKHLPLGRQCPTPCRHTQYTACLCRSAQVFTLQASRSENCHGSDVGEPSCCSRCGCYGRTWVRRQKRPRRSCCRRTRECADDTRRAHAEGG